MSTVLVVCLVANAALGFAYRLYRFAQRGPLGDVIGQAVLGLLLTGIALGVAGDAAWARWAALAYGLSFGLLVMPVWTLAVLIPLPPRPLDYGFTAAYWASLGAIVVAAIAV